MKKLLTLVLAAIFCVGTVSLVGCGAASVSLKYPDHGYANGESNSWEQLTDEDEIITVSWFGDSSTFGSAAQPGTLVYNKILEKTKCRINFTSALDDSGQQLSTMISGNKMPDVITVTSADKRIQIAEEGYAYPIQTLAQKYAPTLLDRIDPDIASFYKASDGNIYGLPNHFYTGSDMQAYEEQSGMALNSNGALVVRKDWLDAYVAHKKSEDAGWSDVEATTPQGFVEMCEWVKKENITARIPTVLLDQFTITNGSGAIDFLSEYFCVPKEDENGKLLLTYEQDEYAEMLTFLNELYRKDIIIDSNFTATHSAISSMLMNGYPFAFVGSPQMYTSSFAQFAKENGTEYVPIVLTNAAGDAPQLRNLSGNGWLFSMITANCKHPDRVIKLFDYLMSVEGQSLFFGVEGNTFDYEVRPGEAVDNVTYKYGQVQWKSEAWQALQNADWADYGFLYSNPLVNPMYPRLASNRGGVFNSYNDYVDHNIKAAITDYTYSQRGLEFARNASDKNYRNIVNKSSSINDAWVEKIPMIIRASSQSEARAIWNATVQQAKAMGSADVLRFDDACFQANKQALGMSYAWPPVDPESGYSSLTVTSIYGNTSYNLAIPSDIKKK